MVLAGMNICQWDHGSQKWSHPAFSWKEKPVSAEIFRSWQFFRHIHIVILQLGCHLHQANPSGVCRNWQSRDGEILLKLKATNGDGRGMASLRPKLHNTTSLLIGLLLRACEVVHKEGVWILRNVYWYQTAGKLRHLSWWWVYCRSWLGKFHFRIRNFLISKVQTLKLSEP